MMYTPSIVCEIYIIGTYCSLNAHKLAFLGSHSSTAVLKGVQGLYLVAFGLAMQKL